MLACFSVRMALVVVALVSILDTAVFLVPVSCVVYLLSHLADEVSSGEIYNHVFITFQFEKIELAITDVLCGF